LPTYVLLVFLLNWALTSFANGRRFAIVVSLAIVQLVDARGEWALQRAMTEPQHALLDRAAWRQLIRAHDAVFIIPTYSCVFGDDGPRLDAVSRDIQWLASEQALPINGTYSARAMRECAREQAEWPTLVLRPRALYVLLPSAGAIADRFQAEGASCGVFDFGRVCSTNESAIADAVRTSILRAPPPPSSLAYGQQLELAGAPISSAGWSPPEPDGRWTDSPVASLLLHLDADPPPGVALELQAQARLCGARQAEDVDVLLDEHLLTTLHFDAGTNDPNTVRTIAITDRGDLRRSAFALQFRPSDLRSPATLGCDADPRRLGIRVSRLWFESPTLR
jgi:hypothetical protein